MEDEGFQDRGRKISYCSFSNNIEAIDDDDNNLESNEKSSDTERYLRSLYGSLSSTMKHVHDIYQSKSSQLR